jgi:hypothetical protein
MAIESLRVAGKVSSGIQRMGARVGALMKVIKESEAGLGKNYGGFKKIAFPVFRVRKRLTVF